MPYVAGKTNSGMTVPTAQLTDVISCRSISLFPGPPCLSLNLSLFGKCLFKLIKALLHCLSLNLTF